MKSVKFNLAIAIALSALISLQACKAKKMAQKPAVTATQPTKPAAPVAAAKPLDRPQTMATTPPPKPNYNFNNIQFDFNSAILRTGSYPELDRAASVMKSNPSLYFTLKGYASIEGTEEHNLILSNDRANSVKEYLVNSGVSADHIIAKGYGTANPVASNDTEEGRELNRRVEIKKADGPNSLTAVK